METQDTLKHLKFSTILPKCSMTTWYAPAPWTIFYPWCCLLSLLCCTQAPLATTLDPLQVAYFYDIHNAASSRGKASQYRSAIFYHSPEQRATAEVKLCRPPCC